MYDILRQMSDFFDKITVSAPVKVNLHLAVKDKRPDGFHNLESVFLAVDFGDTLHFQPNLENITEITVHGINFDIPMEKNIIFKAISLFKEKTGINQGFKVYVEKRIPLGGGLGGGSSDAAAALLALNKIADFPCSRETMLEMAASLGSDVPFFIHQTPAAWVTGRGEIIQPFEIPNLFLVLVSPGFPSDTAAAFRLLDAHRDTHTEISISSFSSVSFVPPCLREMKFEKDGFFNDFLPVFLEKEKAVYNKIISQLQEQGAVFSSLSGAGSTCFGVFEREEQAQKAAQTLRGSWDFVEFCRSGYVPLIA